MNSYFIIIFAAIAVVIMSSPINLTEEKINAEWEKFKVNFNRNYQDEEENMRKKLFTETLKTVEEHNQKYKDGLVTFTMGINNFADMTPEEKYPYSHGVLPPNKRNN